MRVPITVTVAFGHTISIADRDAIAESIGYAIGEPVRVTFAAAIGDTYFDPYRIPDHLPDPDADHNTLPFRGANDVTFGLDSDMDPDDRWDNARRRHPAL